MKKAEKGALDYWKISGSDQKKHFWGALAFAERGEEPMTAGGRNFIGSEVSRNKRPPLCGAAPIEAAEGSHPAPPESEKHPFGCLILAERVGFEPTVRCRTPDFESGPL